MTDPERANPPVGSPTLRLSLFDRLSEGQLLLALIVGALLLYIPFAGTYGLWDPWETHYGEVARQMTKRGDFISLWWPGSPRDAEGFWSKPVFTFWLLSLGMHVARVGLPGGPPDEMAIGHAVEWAVRVPMAVMAVMALTGVFLIVSRFVNRRAAILSSLVLATSPMFSLIARQAMTDMPFVGPMTLALALAALALFDEQDTPLPRRGLGWRSWPHHRLFYITLGVFLLVVLPQLVVDSVQLKFWLNLGSRRIRVYGAIAMIPYYLGSLLFIWCAARARTSAPLYFYLAAMLCGLAVLAKGLAGLGLPIIVFVAYLAFTWNWRRLQRAQLLVATVVSVLAVALVAAPWHHAMIIRHGWAFWNELFGDNHWRRMVMGRHGDRGTFEYFLRELGYAIMPWIALAPAALAALVTRSKAQGAAGARDRRSEIYLFGATWFVCAYAVVSFSMTKFHHYILPALPGLCIVIGCFLDDLLSRSDVRASRLAVLVGLPLLSLIAYDVTKSPQAAQLFLWLFNYDYVHSPVGRPWPSQLNFSLPLGIFTAVFALATLALCWRRTQVWAVVGLCGGALAFTFFLLNVYMRQVTPYWTQKDPIAAYYKTRRSEEDKLVAYMMYWRGETFYSKNQIYEGPQEDRSVFDSGTADQDLQAWLQRHTGQRVFFILERSRQSRLVSLLPASARATFTVIHDKNNKFIMAHADI